MGYLKLLVVTLKMQTKLLISKASLMAAQQFANSSILILILVLTKLWNGMILDLRGHFGAIIQEPDFFQAWRKFEDH